MKTKIKMMLSGLMMIASVVKAQQPAAPGEAGRPPAPPHSPEEHSKQVTAKLEKDLTLSKEQAAKVTLAYQSFYTSMEKVRGKMKPPPPPPPLPPAMKKKADSLSAIRDESIKKALSATQYSKYKEIEKTLRPPHPPEGQQGPPPARSAPGQ